MRVNGFVCKDPKDVKADDFFLEANLDKPRDTTMSKVGSNVTLINVMRIPGLKTLGISLARIDYAPLGENPPHTHPRATEILTVLEGTLYVGFVTSHQQDNKLFTKMLNKGDVSYSQRGSSTSSSTLALTSQQLQLPHLAARTLVLLPLPMLFLDRSHRSRMTS